MWLNSRKFLRHSKKIIFSKKSTKINKFQKLVPKNTLKSVYKGKLTPHKVVSIKTNKFNIISALDFHVLNRFSLYYASASLHYDYSTNKYYNIMCNDIGFNFITPLIAYLPKSSNKQFSNFFKLENSLGLPVKKLQNNLIVSNLNYRNLNYANSQGTYCVVNKVNYNYSLITLPSGKVIRFQGSFYLGKNFSQKKKNYRNQNVVLGVRGVAKNPVDHPNGGRSNTKGSLKTPWGKFAKSNK